jgi:SAM-dependent methyltransferase
MFDNRVIEAGYDVVLVAHVIEHLPDTDAALRWILTRLRPGGRLYLSASRPHWCTAILRWKWGHRAFRPEDFVARLSRAGFAEIRHVPYSAGPPSRTSAGYAAVRPVVRSA